MSIRRPPRADISTRPGARTEVPASALERWNPDVRAADAPAEGVISILDVIGQDIWGEGVTAKRVAGALRAIGDRDVTVHVNSPGGDYFEGLAIYNLLRDHKARVTVKVLGIAASAASVIAMAGDEVQIARAGFLMIHNTWVRAEGDRHALRGLADWLEPFDATAADIYAARTGLAVKDLAAMLDRATWIGGADAVAKGFADSLLSADDVESVPATAAGKAQNALRRIDIALAKAGVPRSERRALVGAVKGDTQDAVAGTQDAALAAQVQGLLSTIRSM